MQGGGRAQRAINPRKLFEAGPAATPGLAALLQQQHMHAAEATGSAAIAAKRAREREEKERADAALREAENSNRTMIQHTVEQATVFVMRVCDGHHKYMGKGRFSPQPWPLNGNTVHPVWRAKCVAQPGQWIPMPAGAAVTPDPRGVDPTATNSAEDCTALLGRTSSTAEGVVSHPPPHPPPPPPPPPAPPPEILYPQGSKHTCVFSAAASALAYAGCEEAAAIVAAQIQGSETFRKPLTGELLRLCNSKPMRKLGISVLGPTYRRGQLDLDDTRLPGILVAQLEASDGFTGHAVAIFDGRIIDANRTATMSLSWKSLSLCCSIDTARLYKQVYLAIRIMLP